MGVICAMKKDYDRSIQYFDKAVEIFPYFVEAWHNKAVNIRPTHLYSHTQKIVRDTEKIILYNTGHDKPCPTSGCRYAPRSDWGDRYHPPFSQNIIQLTQAEHIELKWQGSYWKSQHGHLKRLCLR